jgi:hypothetical protein
MRCCFPYLPLLAGISLSMLTGCETTSRVANRAYHYLPFIGGEEVQKQAPVKGLAFKMELSPKPIKLSDVRQISVKISLENVSRRFVQLQFPTTQRIEILVRDDKGRLVTQWSEDRAYEPIPGYVGINRGERIEYATTISTRDLHAGKSYTVLGFLPNYDKLKSEQVIVPEP